METVINDITDNKCFFSIATDASNKGNRKMFPLMVQYFTYEGVHSKLIDFYECNVETSKSITDEISTRITAFGLKIENVSAFCADNANVNYGRKHSVYTLLKNDNENIVGANCCAHISHNVCKHGSEKLKIDIETLVIKIYNHFSSSSKKREELRDFFEFVQLEWQELLRHIPVRWLSLLPAVERLLKVWPAVKSYFVSLGEDCPQFIANKLCCDDPMNSFDEVELYLHFFHNVMPIFQQTMCSLENSATSIAEVYDIMQSLRYKLQQRKCDNFFGFAVHQAMNKIDKEKKVSYETDFLQFYTRSISYLEKWFNFSEQSNFLFLIRPLALKHDCKLDFNALLKIIECCQFKNTVTVDVLYEELAIAQSVIQKHVDGTLPGSKEMSVFLKWVSVFRICGGEGCLPQLFSIISFILSIPSCNANVERVFSSMNRKWSDVRNRSSIDLIKCELQICWNYQYSCQEFNNYIVNDKKMLAAAKENKKYAFKAKK